MELFLLVIIWPFLIFAIGMIFIAFFAVPFGSESVFGGFGMLSTLFFYAFIFFLIYLIATRKSRKHSTQLTHAQQLAIFRNWMITFSIALILPVIMKYFVEASHQSLASIISVVVIGFALILWGMFGKTNNTIMYGNIFGGALVLLYVYFQLGGLGEFARIIVAGLSLVFAIFIAVLKFKDKLI